MRDPSSALRALAHVARHDQRQRHALLARAVTEGAIDVMVPPAPDHVPAWPAAIPRRIMQYWHDRHPPEDVLAAIDMLRARNDAIDHHLFDEDAAAAFVHAHFGAHIASLFDRCFHNTMKCDLFRLCYLHVHGGIYVDVDIACHAPVASVFASDALRCLLFYAEGRPWCIENGFIATTPGHGAVGAMIDAVAGNLRAWQAGSPFRGVWMETGPGAATAATMGLLARRIAGETDAAAIDDVTLARNDVAGVSYAHAELAYKRDAAGNWRLARAPTPAPDR